jgi:hypothetical protein
MFKKAKKSSKVLEYSENDDVLQNNLRGEISGINRANENR